MSPAREFNPSSDRVRRLATLCAGACGLLAAAIPLYIVLSWALNTPAGLAESDLSPAAPSDFMAGGIAPWQRAAGALIWLVPGGLLSWGLLHARKALLAVSQARFFAAEAVQGLYRYASATLWAALASFLATPFLSVAMTLPNPPGHRELTLGLSSNQLLAVLTAGIFWVMAAALSRGAALARENEQFV
jgi:hypothetical protein